MSEPDGEEITARRRAIPQERACPTCGGPVVTTAQREAEIADYHAWVDRGAPRDVAPAPITADDIRRAFDLLPDHFPEPKCGNCGRGLPGHGPAPDYQCPPVVTLRDLLQRQDRDGQLACREDSRGDPGVSTQQRVERARTQLGRRQEEAERIAVERKAARRAAYIADLRSRPAGQLSDGQKLTLAMYNAGATLTEAGRRILLDPQRLGPGWPSDLRRSGHGRTE